MTTTTGLFEHIPIVAYGKAGRTAQHTDLVAVEATRTMTFNNSSNTIIAGDHVFTATSADAKVQYMGVCITTAAGSITTQYPIQDGIASNGHIWVPTAAVDFQYSVAEGGQRRGIETGTRLFVSRGATVYPMQYQDAYMTLQLSLNPAHPGDWEEWQTFILTTRTYCTKGFSLAYWDAFLQKSRTLSVLVFPDDQTVVKINKAVAAFTLRFFAVADDTYVTT